MLIGEGLLRGPPCGLARRCCPATWVALIEGVLPVKWRGASAAPIRAVAIINELGTKPTGRFATDPDDR